VYEANGGGVMGIAAELDTFNPVSVALNTLWGITGSTSPQGAGCAAAFGLLQLASFFAPGAGGGVVRSIAGAIEKGIPALGRASQLIGDISIAERFAKAVDGLVCNCFPAGTLVATSKGDKAIEDVQVGDQVWAKNLTTGKRELRTVVGLFNKHTDELMDITVAGTVVSVTSKHPFYVPGRGWVMSGLLHVGDKLLQRDGTIVTITAIRHYAADTTVYNFEVEGDHNYYVSQAQLLVHNCTLFTKATSPIWQSTKSFRGSIKTNGLTGSARRYFVWDYTHGDIEVFDKLGNHLGSMDPGTGDMIKPAVPGRTITI
jgi:hypothetical protein